MFPETRRTSDSSLTANGFLLGGQLIGAQVQTAPGLFDASAGRIDAAAKKITRKNKESRTPASERMTVFLAPPAEIPAPHALLPDLTRHPLYFRSSDDNEVVDEQMEGQIC